MEIIDPPLKGVSLQTSGLSEKDKHTVDFQE